MIKEVSIGDGILIAKANSLAPNRVIIVSKLQDKIRIESVELVYLTIPEYSLKITNESTVAPMHNKNANAKSFGLNWIFFVS